MLLKNWQFLTLNSSINLKIKFQTVPPPCHCTTHHIFLYALTMIPWYTVKETVWEILKKDELGRYPEVAHRRTYVKWWSLPDPKIKFWTDFNTCATMQYPVPAPPTMHRGLIWILQVYNSLPSKSSLRDLYKITLPSPCPCTTFMHSGKP